MSIAPMCRVTICGPLVEKDAILEALQGLGVLHAVPLKAPDPLTPIDAAGRRRAEMAFRHISEAPEQLRIYRKGAPFDVDAVIAEITANRLKLKQLSDRRDALVARIADVSDWGEFRFPEPAALGGQRFWFYCVPVRQRTALAALALPWAIVGRAPDRLFVVVIAPDEPPADLLPVPRIHMGAKPLNELRDELEAIEIEIERTGAERGELTRWRLLLAEDLAAAEDRDARKALAAETLDCEALFAIAGWAPQASRPQIERFADESRAAVVFDSPGEDDRPPTLLQTADPRFGAGSDLTNFYTTPAYRSWDPSFIVLVSFAIFFAMITADAGYALVIGLITAFYWKRMGATANGRRFRIMLAMITVACLIYGVMAGSYFGVAPRKGSFLAAMAPIDITSFDAMMKLSVLIGAVHVGIALAMATWRKRSSLAALGSGGWILVIAGGLAMWLGEGVLKAVGPLLLVAGFCAVFVGGAAGRKVTGPKDWLLKTVDGLMGLTSVTKLFGDILSYLRLFALGLASASLATTFNTMATGVDLARPGLGLLMSILILAFGHTINFVIGIMGGVVHGLRLNYIEFFGWGLPDEGYPFSAFAKKEIRE
ncbi:MAG TPA: V-type ATP synthase subunit I [Kaistia sp.]|nr:V-type ATP synthase subunit I [Kaistia sp.]